MKTLLGIAVISLALFVGGCTTTTQPQAAPPAAQGQPGPAGQPGQTGQTGDQGATGQTGQAGQTGNTGQTGQTGEVGQTGQTGQTGEKGKAAPCPAGQHRHTNPDTGKDHCVPD